MTKTTPFGIGWSIGVESPTLLSLHGKVKDGLPYQAIAHLGRAAGIEPTVVIRHIDLTPSTNARRRQTGRLKPDEAGRVVRLGLLIEQATGLFEGDVPAALHWLQSPARALGGVTPLELARSEPGARAVEQLIGRLEHGVFS